MEKKQKSVHLDNDIHKKLRILVAQEETYIGDKVNEILRKELNMEEE